MSRHVGSHAAVLGSQENIPALKWWEPPISRAASVALWTLASGTLGDMLSLALNAWFCGLRHGLERLAVFHAASPICRWCWRDGLDRAS